MSFLRSLTRSFPMMQRELGRNFSNDKPWKEVTIPVPWGKVRGKWWGPADKRPILSLHGWQDNCGTFDRLIPLLNDNVSYLTIDLPGHGFSSRLPPGVPYEIITYLTTVQYIKQYLGWQKVSLMGHSMGGGTCFTYAALYPKEIDFLITLDGTKPLVPRITSNRLTEAFAQFIKNNSFLDNTKEPPSYTIDSIKEKIHQPNQGSVLVEFTQYLIERNTAPSKIHPGQYYFTRDPRLKVEMLLYLSQEEIVQNALNICCPIFFTKSKDAIFYEAKENFFEVIDMLKRTSPDFNFHYLKGTHHLHLNNPETELAGLLQGFIDKYNIEDRIIGGLKQEMVVNGHNKAKL